MEAIIPGSNFEIIEITDAATNEYIVTIDKGDRFVLSTPVEHLKKHHPRPAVGNRLWVVGPKWGIRLEPNALAFVEIGNPGCGCRFDLRVPSVVS